MGRVFCGTVSPLTSWRSSGRFPTAGCEGQCLAEGKEASNYGPAVPDGAFGMGPKEDNRGMQQVVSRMAGPASKVCVADKWSKMQEPESCPPPMPLNP
jgi:hypothetical protein